MPAIKSRTADFNTPPSKQLSKSKQPSPEPSSTTPKPSPASDFCTSAKEAHVAELVEEAAEPSTMTGRLPEARTHTRLSLANGAFTAREARLRYAFWRHFPEPYFGTRPLFIGDRKSTRLNSSPVS